MKLERGKLIYKKYPLSMILGQSKDREQAIHHMLSYVKALPNAASELTGVVILVSMLDETADWDSSMQTLSSQERPLAMHLDA